MRNAKTASDQGPDRELCKTRSGEFGVTVPTGVIRKYIPRGANAEGVAVK